MNTTNTKTSKLATFRVDELLWEQFVTKAKEAGENASAVLLRSVRAYLDGHAIAHSQSQSSLSPVDTTPSIFLAIAPDNQILCIDRAINSPHWLPPYQLRQTDSRFEWLSSSDPSLLSALEDVLIEAFQPPLNFRPKPYSQTSPAPIAETTQHKNLPPEIIAKVEHLLTNGFSTLDVLTALETVSQPKLEAKIESPPEPLNLPAPQLDNSLVEELKTLTKSITSLQQQFNERITAVENKVKESRKKESSPKSQPKPEPTPKILKGTASLDEIPKHPENTRALAKRWGISDKILTRQRQRYQDRLDGFFLYSLEKEQGRFGWIYDPDAQLFYALTELPERFLSKSPQPEQPDAIAQSAHPEPTPTPAPQTDKKTEPKSLPSPLTAAQLGERFISPQTRKPISAKGIEQALKRSDAQSFAEYCRLRDPDGYAWRYDRKSARFIVLT